MPYVLEQNAAEAPAEILLGRLQVEGISGAQPIETT
jgi:hypothetical protein